MVSTPKKNTETIEQILYRIHNKGNKHNHTYNISDETNYIYKTTAAKTIDWRCQRVWNLQEIMF